MKDGSISFVQYQLDAKVILNYFPDPQTDERFTDEEREICWQLLEDFNMTLIFQEDGCTCRRFDTSDIQFLLKYFPKLDDPRLMRMEREVFERWIDNLTYMLMEYQSDNEI